MDALLDVGVFAGIAFVCFVPLIYAVTELRRLVRQPARSTAKLVLVAVLAVIWIVAIGSFIGTAVIKMVFGVG